MRRRVYGCALLFAMFGCSGVAGEFSEVRVAGKQATVCRVDVRKERVEVFLRDGSGEALKSFESVERFLAGRGERLVFAMNAGMYQRDFSPVGLLVGGGRELSPLNTSSGYGNFFMKPNGVFVITETGPRVVETSEYPKLKGRIRLATQSGPLLVRAGRVHSGFNTNSNSRVIRNGIGVSGDGKAVFAICEEPVNLYEFAVLFRDVLGCPDALYLDGVISSLHAPDLKRSDKKTELGPIIGVVAAGQTRSSP